MPAPSGGGGACRPTAVDPCPRCPGATALVVDTRLLGGCCFTSRQRAAVPAPQVSTGIMASLTDFKPPPTRVRLVAVLEDLGASKAAAVV